MRQFCSYQSKSGHSQWMRRSVTDLLPAGPDCRQGLEPAAANRRCAAAGTIEAVAGPLVWSGDYGAVCRLSPVQSSMLVNSKEPRQFLPQ